MLVYIEGNIGAGKTTFLELFKDYLQENLPNSGVLPEPVKKWMDTKDSNGKSILEHYYQDQ